METDAEWKAFDGMLAEARQRPERVEKLAYRAAGTMSVPAQPPGQEAAPGEADATPAGLEQAAAIVRLEQRLRASESAASARVEQLRREGYEALEEVRRQAERQLQATQAA